jgi:hypothetical protein
VCAFIYYSLVAAAMTLLGVGLDTSIFVSAISTFEKGSSSFFNRQLCFASLSAPLELAHVRYSAFHLPTCIFLSSSTTVFEFCTYTLVRCCASVAICQLDWLGDNNHTERGWRTVKSWLRFFSLHAPLCEIMIEN